MALPGYLLTAVVTGSLAVLASYYFNRTPEIRQNRFSSTFVPAQSQARWYVDGQDYMSAVADAIEAASDEIFITDWQMNPHIFMKRPDTGVDSLYWRLDKMLLRKADQGRVKIYILLYWESKVLAGMDHGSDFVRVVLNHDNISVLVHPDLNTAIHHGFEGTGWWSHHEKVVVVDRKIAFVGGIDLCFGRWDTHSHELVDDYPVHPCVAGNNNHCDQSEGKDLMYSRWIGKDYGNTFYGGVRAQLDQPMVDYIDRSEIPRMPWHDVGCSFTGPPVQDVSKHFIQRYNSHSAQPWWKIWGDEPLRYLEDKEYSATPDSNGYDVQVQVLRSVDQWSTEEDHEASIYNAYLHVINESKHFIYIENQFFISSQKGVFLKVKNQILSAIADRIVRAYKDDDDFHVIVVMPLKPEFPGEWEAESGKDLRSVSYWNYLSIYSGEDSLYRRLENGKIPQDIIPQYFNVYGLRTHCTLNNNLVTEIIYVHSKMMVVDDRVAIIGSANINDRSMLGYRDSEVAVIIEDREMVDGKMNGQHFEVGKFSHSLRCHLMREHLGLLDDEEYVTSDMKVDDPLAATSFLLKVAQRNNVIYDRVFGGRITPSNHVWNLEDLTKRSAIRGLVNIDLNEAKKELNNVQGSIVSYPVLFLKDILKPSYLDVLGVYVDTRGRAKTLNFDEPGTVFV